MFVEWAIPAVILFVGVLLCDRLRVIVERLGDIQVSLRRWEGEWNELHNPSPRPGSR